MTRGSADTKMQLRAEQRARQIAARLGLEQPALRPASDAEIAAYDPNGSWFERLDHQLLVDRFVAEDATGRRALVRVVSPNRYDGNLRRALSHVIGALPLVGPAAQALRGATRLGLAQLKQREGDQALQRAAGLQDERSALRGALTTALPSLALQAWFPLPLGFALNAGVELGLAGKDALDALLDLSARVYDWRSTGVLMAP